MARYVTPTDSVAAWLEATTARPCPSCGATSRCSTLENGEFVRCFQNVSQWPVLTGGWLHPNPAPVGTINERLAVTA